MTEVTNFWIFDLQTLLALLAPLSLLLLLLSTLSEGGDSSKGKKLSQKAQNNSGSLPVKREFKEIVSDSLPTKVAPYPVPIGKYSEDIVLGLLVRVIANLQGGWRIQKHERHRDPYDLLLLGPKKRVYTIEVKSTTKVVIDRLLMEEISRAQRRCDIVILYVFPFKAGYIFFPGERKLYKLGHGTLLRRLREIEACRAMQRQIEEKLEEARVSEVEDGERGDEDVGGDVSVPE